MANARPSCTHGKNGHAQARLGRFHHAARLEHRIDGTASQNVSQAATRRCDCGHARPVAGSGGNAGCAKILAECAPVRRWWVPNPSVLSRRKSEVRGAAPSRVKPEGRALLWANRLKLADIDSHEQ